MSEEQGTGETSGFVQALMMLDEGTVVSDCGDSLHKLTRELTEYARHYGKAKGTLVLKLTMGIEEGGTADLRAEVTTKAPKITRPKTTAWVTKDGKLSTKNPRQLELGAIRMVAPQPIRRDVTS